MRLSFNGVFGEVDSLPGCSQVAVSHSVFIPEELRNGGDGTKANAQRCDYFKNVLGYDYALCTVDQANTAQIKVLTKNNWLCLGSFKSSKTGHFVGIYGKPL